MVDLVLNERFDFMLFFADVFQHGKFVATILKFFASSQNGGNRGISVTLHLLRKIETFRRKIQNFLSQRKRNLLLKIKLEMSENCVKVPTLVVLATKKSISIRQFAEQAETKLGNLRCQAKFYYEDLFAVLLGHSIWKCRRK